MSSPCERHHYGPTTETRIDPETDDQLAEAWFERTCRRCGHREEWSYPDRSAYASVARFTVARDALMEEIADRLRRFGRRRS